MKKLLILLSLASLMLTIIISCKKDNNQDPPEEQPIVHDTLYYVQYQGKKYEINKCHVFIEDIWGSNGYDFSVYLASSTVIYSDPPINDIYGTGNGIKLNVHTNNSSFFFHSIYATDTTGTPTDLYFLKNSATIYINEDIFIDGTNFSLASGNCNIVNAGTNIYELTAHLIKSPNIPINIYYKGSIPIHPVR